MQWVNNNQFRPLNSWVYFTCFRFCLLCSKLESIKHCQFRKQHNDYIHSTRNSKKTYCST